MNENCIQLTQISKTFQTGRPNEFTAVKNININIALCSFVVFKGPSGSGKTTLLSLIGCMNRPTTGRILIEDKEITGLPEKFLTRVRRKRFGFIFQDFRLVPSLSVIENIMLPAWPLRKKGKQIKRHATELLDRLGIRNKERVRPHHLSGGEKQRVAIARALINNPDILIADEPTSHLDSDFSIEIINIMKDLRHKGKTVLIASHDPLVTAADNIDHLVQLRDGKIVREA